MTRLPDLFAPMGPGDGEAPDPPLKGGKCRECGGNIEPNRWQPRIGRVLVENQLCIRCQGWLEAVLEKDDPKQVRVDGWVFNIAPEDPELRKMTGGFGLGHGGRRFRIRFDDGREVVTTNLWNSGEIPERFRKRLPDNAVFVREGE